MKLLRDFFRRCPAGIRAVFVRRAANPRAFTVTVPAPLAEVIRQQPVLVELPRVRVEAARRREPASFLKAARHRRLGAGR